MQKKPTPGPVFNHRKRPRQAVFADPINDAIPGPSGAASVQPPSVPKFSDLMPVQDFGQGRTQPIQSQQRSQPRANMSATPLKPVPVCNANQGAYRQAMSFNSTFQQRQQPGVQTNRGRNNNLAPLPGGRFTTNKQQTFSTSFTGFVSNPGPYGDMGRQQRQPHIGTPRPYGRGYSGNFSVIGRRTNSSSNCPVSTSFDADDDFDTTSFANSNKPATSTAKPTMTAKKTANDIDRSLHFITSTVAGVRRWNRFKDNIQLLFEIYGILDSAVTKTGSDRREFLLRDERKDAVKCVFYEIDRQLPKLTRGQGIRCVGTLDSKTDSFRIVSVRPVQDTERGLSRQLINKSDQIMLKLTKTLRES